MEFYTDLLDFFSIAWLGVSRLEFFSKCQKKPVYLLCCRHCLAVHVQGVVSVEVLFLDSDHIVLVAVTTSSNS